MKVLVGGIRRVAAAFIGVAVASDASAMTARYRTGRVAPAGFGPAGCVTLSQSSAGTCTLATNCEDQDISKVEFAFDCQARTGGDIVRHSFGVGGFDSNEDFDTEVKCHSCSLPLPDEEVIWPTKPVSQPVQQQPRKVQKPVPKPSQKEAQQQPAMATALRLEGRAGQKAQVRYGPKNCISTYKSKEGHCIMQTDCVANEIKDYEFGLVCVDKAGSPVRHLFGKDSFDPKETFDTLITCDRCLGLEDVPGDVALVGQVAALSKEVASLKGMMMNLTDDIGKLESKVFPVAAKVASPSGFVTSPPANASYAMAAADGEGSGEALPKPPQHRQRRNLRAAMTDVVAAPEPDDVPQRSPQRKRQRLLQRRQRPAHRRARRQLAEVETLSSDDSDVREEDQRTRPSHHLRRHGRHRPVLEQQEEQTEDQANFVEDQDDQKEEQEGNEIASEDADGQSDLETQQDERSADVDESERDD